MNVCDLCIYNPPSSCDGKPCTMCPATTNMALEQEQTDRIEYGTDGNLYKLTISNGKEFETGHWITKQNEVFKYYCDKCGTGDNLRTNYCPNCGAKMESEE